MLVAIAAQGRKVCGWSIRRISRWARRRLGAGPICDYGGKSGDDCRGDDDECDDEGLFVHSTSILAQTVALRQFFTKRPFCRGATSFCRGATSPKLVAGTLLSHNRCRGATSPVWLASPCFDSSAKQAKQKRPEKGRFFSSENSPKKAIKRVPDPPSMRLLILLLGLTYSLFRRL